MRGRKVQNNGLIVITLPKLSISKTVKYMKIRKLQKAILSAKRKEYRDVAKKREEKRKQNAEYREKMKTHWQWLQEGRIPDPHARWRVGEELNRTYNTLFL